MNRTFDFYEYAGIIIPGAVLVMALVFLFPEGRALLSKEGVTLGELGLFVIIAYATGQLVQAIGNYLEWIWWRLWGGMPSTQVLCGKYLSPNQHKRILDELRLELGDVNPSKLPQRERLAIVRELYTQVAAAGKATRVDTFSGSYGLMRGLAAALAVIFVFAVATDKGASALIASGILFLLAVHRMHRYGWHYATELCLQFLAVRKEAEGCRERSSLSPKT
jgi:hypothetical protein